MRARNALIVIVVTALAVMAGGVAACGGSDSAAKATLSAALTKVEASAAKFQQMGTNTTTAEIKAARDELAPLWSDVVAAAKNVKGADATAAATAWTTLDNSVNSLPADANIIQAAGTVLGPIQALLKLEAELRGLVSPTTT
jgi:hypothetical protein